MAFVNDHSMKMDSELEEEHWESEEEEAALEAELQEALSSLSLKVRPAIFSTDPTAKKVRDSIDYTIKITKEMAMADSAGRPVRVLADGIYDLFHHGHGNQLQQAKNLFPNVYLIVGIVNDETTHEKKGNTVMNNKERVNAVRHCRYVDEIVENQPWFLSEDFLQHHKIDFVAHDDLPYVSGSKDLFAHLKASGRFMATNRTDAISTSDLIARIVKDYDIYARRNLSRGYSAHDLNVSRLAESKFRFQNQVRRVARRGREIVDHSFDFLHRWEHNSRHYIGTFLQLFGTEGINFWNANRGLPSPPPSPTDGSISPEPIAAADWEAPKAKQTKVEIVSPGPGGDADIPSTVREDALEKVRTFLWGSWKEVANEEIIISRIHNEYNRKPSKKGSTESSSHLRGGLSNYHFKCTLAPSVPILDGEPRAVIYRLYGEILRDNTGGVVIDTVVFALLSEKKFGPRLYGIFKHGRIEHFISDSRSLLCREIAIPSVAARIAEQMAKFHAMDMPLRKKPTFMISLAQKWLDDLRPTAHTLKLPQDLDLDLEWEKLQLIMNNTPSKVVLCHNDLQEGNILIVERDPQRRLISGHGVDEGSEDEIRMIDFEYAAYNHRGFDISQHFNEYCYDYDVAEPPYFRKDASAYPSREHQMEFYRSYLRTLRDIENRRTKPELKRQTSASQSIESESESESLEAELEDLFRETNVFSLFTHLVWTLWALRQATLSKIQFGFSEYAMERAQHYLDHKEWLSEVGLIKDVPSISKS